MSVIHTAVSILKFEEGFRGHLYNDHLGYATIGYGKLLSKRLQAEGFPPDFPDMPEPVATAWLHYDVRGIVYDVNIDFPDLDDIRQAVIVSMIYQLGASGFSKFYNTIEAINNKDFELASQEMLDSRWAKQTPERAKRHADMMLSGVLLQEY